MMAMLHGQAAITYGETTNKPVSLSMIATEMGMKIPHNDLISIGVELKKRYVANHGKEPRATTLSLRMCYAGMTRVLNKRFNPPAARAHTARRRARGAVVTPVPVWACGHTPS
jgi:hypothetical protein